MAAVNSFDLHHVQHGQLTACERVPKISLRSGLCLSLGPRGVSGRQSCRPEPSRVSRLMQETARDRHGETRRWRLASGFQRAHRRGNREVGQGDPGDPYKAGAKSPAGRAWSPANVFVSHPRQSGERSGMSARPLNAAECCTCRRWSSSMPRPRAVRNVAVQPCS